MRKAHVGKHQQGERKKALAKASAFFNEVHMRYTERLARVSLYGNKVAVLSERSECFISP